MTRLTSTHNWRFIHLSAPFLLAFVMTISLTTHMLGQDARDVLIIQDEMTALHVLIEYLEEVGGRKVAVVDQSSIPEDLSPYRAVIGYIHRGLEEKTELDIIGYTAGGGKFICLHHTISSGKAANKYFFDFLGVQLDHPEYSSQPVRPGEGYGWYHDGEKGINWTMVNLNPKHYITSHKIEWGKKVQYRSSDGPSVAGSFPGIVLKATEVYMNHKFIDGREKTVLCGLKFQDQRNGELFMQDRAAWMKDNEKGTIFYFMPGDRASDYADRNMTQMILNAVESSR